MKLPAVCRARCGRLRTAPRNRATLHIALFVITALAAACGSGGHTSSSSTSTTTTVSAALPPVDEPEPSLEQLVGTWQNDGGPTPSEPDLMVRLSPDGTMAFDNSGFLDSDPAVVGTYALESHTVHFTAGPSDVCTTGDTWSWTVGRIDENHLHSVISEDGTGNCHVGLGTEWTWTRAGADT